MGIYRWNQMRLPVKFRMSQWELSILIFIVYLDQANACLISIWQEVCIKMRFLSTSRLARNWFSLDLYVGFDFFQLIWEVFCQLLPPMWLDLPSVHYFLVKTNDEVEVEAERIFLFLPFTGDVFQFQIICTIFVWGGSSFLQTRWYICTITGIRNLSNSEHIS